MDAAPHGGRVTMEQRIPWLAGTARGGPWLVGVSGGADSVALVHVLVDAGFEGLVVCHLNHQLRGRASTEDARFVERLAVRLGLVFEIGRVDVRGRMERAGESMETAARNERHRFFADCAARHGSERVLLGHHADDQAETVLWNLLRGSHGLKGMREKQWIGVNDAGGMPTRLCLLRPLLGLRHLELVEWLRGRGLRWREDLSNGEPVAVRNRLRNEVLPLMDEVSGRDAAAAFARGAADAAGLADFLFNLIDEANLRDPQGRLHVGALRKQHPLLRREALRGFLVEQGIGAVDRSLLERGLGLLEATAPAVLNLPGGARLRRRAGRIWVEPPNGSDNFGGE